MGVAHHGTVEEPCHAPQEIETPVERFITDLVGEADAWFRRIEPGRIAEVRSTPDEVGGWQRLGANGAVTSGSRSTRPNAHDHDSRHYEPADASCSDRRGHLRTPGGGCQ